MIKVEIFINPEIGGGIKLDLNTFFRMAYPLKYSHVLSCLNEQLEEGQTLIIHQSETIDKFLERFKTPRDIVNFMLENKEEEKIGCITIGEAIYVSINQVIYMFYEE